MGDGLIISGGGSIEVASDELFDRAARLETAEATLRSALTDLARIDRGVSGALLHASDAPISAARAEQAIDDATWLLAHSADGSGQLAANLHRAAAAYGLVEGSAARMSQALFAELGWAAGFMGSVVGPLLLPAALGALASGATAVTVWGLLPSGATRSISDTANGLGRQVLSDPRFVQLVRLGAMSVDDAELGARKVPSPVSRMLGDEGIGVRGLDSTAAGVIGVAAAAGMLRETAVTVRQTSVTGSTRATGIAERAARIPQGSDQIRIDTYSAPGRPDRYELFIGGTVDFSPTATTEPFDLTSNLQGLANSDAGAYRAVRDALHAQGVPAGAEILIAGYSQGGLLGAQLAASGDYEVVGLLTLGAPAGQVEVPASVPWIAVEHSDDLVPALGGTFQSMDAIVVRREAAGDLLDSPYVFPAHQRQRYVETAALIDGTQEGRIVAASRAFDDLGADAARVTSTTYQSERLPPR